MNKLQLHWLTKSSSLYGYRFKFLTNSILQSLNPSTQSPTRRCFCRHTKTFSICQIHICDWTGHLRLHKFDWPAEHLLLQRYQSRALFACNECAIGAVFYTPKKMISTVAICRRGRERDSCRHAMHLALCLCMVRAQRRRRPLTLRCRSRRVYSHLVSQRRVDAS